MMATFEISETSLEHAVAAFIREVIVAGGRPGLLEKFEAGGIEEVRKYMKTNPEVVRHVRATLTAYFRAECGEI